MCLLNTCLHIFFIMVVFECGVHYFIVYRTEEDSNSENIDVRKFVSEHKVYFLG